MENKYTSLEISRLIQSKVPEVETELWYSFRMSSVYQKKKLYTTTQRYSLDEEVYSFYPAYRLDDVLRAIKVLGEKQGKFDYVRDWRGVRVKNSETEVDEVVDGTEIEWQCHRLLTAYIEDGLQFGERCEGVIRSIFEV